MVGRKSVSYIFYVLFSFVLLVSGCGSNDYAPSSGTGSIAFGVNWEGAPTLAPSNLELKTSNAALMAASLDCTTSGVNTVSATVYDSANNAVASGGPWSCSAHTGTVNNIPAGSNLKFVVSGKDSSGNVLYQGSQTGVTITASQTTNVGTIIVTKAWTTLTPTSEYITTVVIDPVTPSIVYAAGQGLFKSMDGGDSWLTIALPNNGYIAHLSIDPVNPSVLYGVVFGSGGIGNGVYKSTDGGINWSLANSGLPQMDNSLQLSPVAIDPVTPATLYVKPYYTGGGSYTSIFKSTDSGNTWQAVATNLTFNYAHKLVIDPITPSTIYACTSGNALVKSTDGGIVWTNVNNLSNGLTVYTLVFDPITPTTLYVGTNGGPYKSTDNGATWLSTPTQGPQGNQQTMAIVVDTSKPGTMYAAGARGEVFRSTNYGNSWQWVGTVPDGMDTYELVINSISQKLYARTIGKLYKLDMTVL